MIFGAICASANDTKGPLHIPRLNIRSSSVTSNPVPLVVFIAESVFQVAEAC